MSTKINITIDQGSYFEGQFSIAFSNGAAMDLSDYTGRSQVRKHYTSLEFYEIDVNLTSNGSIELYANSAYTANMEPGRYMYDVEITENAGETIRVLEGILTVTPNITI